ncbi:uncharacterized protein CBL_04185 [Carabus blaptoides fortunei]
MDNISVKRKTMYEKNEEIDCIILDSDDSDHSAVTLKRKAGPSVESDDDTEPVKAPKRKRIERKNNLKNTKKVTKTTNSKTRLKVEIEQNNSKISDIDNQLNTDTSLKDEWSTYELLAEKEKLNCKTAETIIKLFEAGNTIPFIARYRKHLTNDMSPEKLRDVKESYEEICALKSKTATVLKTIEKAGKLSKDLKKCVLNCRSLPELEHIYAPFKVGGKRTLAERAKSLGLEGTAEAILTGSTNVNIEFLIKHDGPEGLRTVEEIEKNIMHIVAHNITTDTQVLTFIRNLRSNLFIKIESKRSSSLEKVKSSENISKFEHYFNFHISVNNIRPHQVLAINRGENLKILSVKVIVPDYAFHKFKQFCEQKWLNGSMKTSTRIRIFQESLKDSYKRLICPLIVRQTRAELKANAEKASIDVFTMNLKKLLLGTPLKGQAIIGIDPGFSLGCKLAVISPLGDVLDTGVIYPHTKKSSNKDQNLVKELLIKHNCTLIALGNGTACRETEKWITDLIQSKFFQPLDVRCTIIDEQGASIYSCSPEAKKEFPNLDALVISAASLARRLQDPLAELVKVEPKHLGVGMYQHDINKKSLESALDEVVSECVSFVGVDLNTASRCLLKRVAGLSTQRTDNIIKHRTKHGPFTNRYQLKDVKGIGEKIFEQCAGFLRVGPLNAKDSYEFYQKPDTMPLDCTWIHPESYDLAEKIMNKFNLYYKHIGLPKFITSFKSAIGNLSVPQLAIEFKASETTVKLITDVLSRPLDHDLRQENPQKPLFRTGITSMHAIKPNMVLTGRVTNCTHFGAFVDIGVGKNGLIHTRSMKGMIIELGDRVEVKVLSIEIDRGRIALEPIQKI